jgi:acetyl esterase/lipase
MASLRFLLDLLRRPSARYRYGPAPLQRIDLHLPPGDGPHPVAILIHGGSWLGGLRYSKLLMRPVAADLTRRGWAAWNVEYRRGNTGGWPVTFDDVAAAVDLLAEKNDERLDLERLVAIGHSAGGQLALWVGARPTARAGAPGRDPRVRISRVASLAGVCVMEEPARGEPVGAIGTFLGGGPDEVPDRYAEAEPLSRVPLGIPTLLVHGKADETIPLKRSRQYAQAARAAGDEVELVEIPGADHRDPIDPRGECWAAVVGWL